MKASKRRGQPFISQKSKSKMVSFSTAIVAATIALSSSSPNNIFCNAFVPTSSNINIPSSQSQLHAIDEKMMERLDGIRRSYNALTERLADPDVIGDSNLLRKVMSDRSKSEEVVLAFEEVRFLLLFIFFELCMLYVRHLLRQNSIPLTSPPASPLSMSRNVATHTK